MWTRERESHGAAAAGRDDDGDGTTGTHDITSRGPRALDIIATPS